MDDAPGRSLDPFEFHGHPASAIAGLGGGAPLPDPSYGFHTSYVGVARGHAHFLVKFTNLRARRGSLVLRVHMLPDEPDATARMVTSHRVQLSWLAHHGGETRLRFEAFRGARYALMGVIPDQLDASADDLTITLDRPADETAPLPGADADEARATAFASETIKAVSAPLIVSVEAPSFAHPVSQPCTVRQLRETAFRNRCRALSDMPDDPAACWEIAYAVQVMERYGVLRPGSRGIGFATRNPAVERAVTSMGATIGHFPSNEDGQNDLTELTDDLFAFDFLYSIRAVDELDDRGAAIRFIERAMECLRPGGLAVHVVGHRAESTSPQYTTFDRNGLERIAFALVSRGHQAARLKPPLASHTLESGADGVVPFGLVARRAALIR